MENEICQVLLLARPETQPDLASPGSGSSLPFTSLLFTTLLHFWLSRKGAWSPVPHLGLSTPLLLLANKGRTHRVTASIWAGIEWSMEFSVAKALARRRAQEGDPKDRLSGSSWETGSMGVTLGKEWQDRAGWPSSSWTVSTETHYLLCPYWTLPGGEEHRLGNYLGLGWNPSRAISQLCHLGDDFETSAPSLSLPPQHCKERTLSL